MKQETLHTSEQRRIMAKRILLNGLLLAGAFVMLTPLLWMLATALSPNTLVAPASLIPHDITLQNFVEAWYFPSTFGRDLTLGRFFLNSIISTAVITVVGVIVDSLAAYVLAYKKFKGKTLFYYATLATMMIPVYVTLVPEYLLIRDLGWMNSFKALIIPFLASGMGIQLFRSSFLGLSKELVEAAKMDGASDLRIYATIIMPISRPTIGTMCILKFMWSWNQYIWPLVVCTNLDMQTIQLGLNLFRGLNLTQWGYLCAGMTMAIIPVVVVFLLAQKQFIGGLTTGAVKG